MLYFVHPPDPPFTALLKLTNRLVTATFRERWPAEHHAQAFPTVAPWWAPKPAAREWRWLWELSERTQVYTVDDHHWALLYDGLRFAIAAVDQTHEPGRQLPLGPIQVGVIDGELLIDAYFWNLRFLAEDFAPPKPGTRQATRISRPGAWMRFDPYALYRPDSTRYPDPRSPDDTRHRRDGEAVAYQIPGLPEIMAERAREFRERFGREMQAGDPVFWDPDADTPTPLSEDKPHDDGAGPDRNRLPGLWLRLPEARVPRHRGQSPRLFP